MADRAQRTAADRERARLQREQRRSEQAGQTPHSPEPVATPEPVAPPERVAPPQPGATSEPPAPQAPTTAESVGPPEPIAPPRSAAASEPPATSGPPVPSEPPATSGPPVPSEPPTTAEPVGRPVTPEPPEPLIAPRRDLRPAPAAADPDASLVETRETPPRAPAPAMRSFPSPPDPDLYTPDEELESPSGTRRVPRGSGGADRRPPRGGRTAPGAPRRVAAGRASRSRRWLGRIVALILLGLVAVIVVAAIEVYQPFGTSPHGRVRVRIPAGTGVSAVGRILARDKVISSSLFFELRATLDGDRSRIRAGAYELARGMSYATVLSRLTALPKQAKTSPLTLAEGHTRQYVAALLDKEHIRGSYLTATRHSPLLSPRHYGAPRSVDTLEGFLFPDTYTLRDPIHASALVADQLRDFKRRFATVNLTQAHRLHLSGYDIVTIASLIEAESASVADDRRVASVIDNRLRDHMMLQLDSTARYATGNFTKALTVTQLDSKSPYNTHTHFGLPPGPINSPGLTALNAAAHPASSPYLYFFSKPCTSQTVFATSYAQFNLLLLRDRRTHCPK